MCYCVLKNSIKESKKKGEPKDSPFNILVINYSFSFGVMFPSIYNRVISVLALERIVIDFLK